MMAASVAACLVCGCASRTQADATGAETPQSAASDRAIDPATKNVHRTLSDYETTPPMPADPRLLACWETLEVTRWDTPSGDPRVISRPGVVCRKKIGPAGVTQVCRNGPALVEDTTSAYRRVADDIILVTLTRHTAAPKSVGNRGLSHYAVVGDVLTTTFYSDEQSPPSPLLKIETRQKRVADDACTATRF